MRVFIIPRNGCFINIMKKATYFTNEFYLNNRLFDLDDNISNRDNCMYPNYLLKKKLMEKGYDLSTKDVNPVDKSEIVIYSDCLPPKNEENNENSFLILNESEMIRPKLWQKKNHHFFKKIFTWSPELVDEEKYIRIYWPNLIDIKKQEKSKPNLCCMISANKKNYHPNSLYPKRLEIIKWFEKNHPNEFDLYGIGWDKYVFGNKLDSVLTKFHLGKLFFNQRTSYRGKIVNKAIVLKDYKFSFCLENAFGFNGYITEKIFDAFFSFSIPIYMGAPDVKKYIPPNTFIDINKFKSIKELYSHLSKMDNNEYDNYLHNIHSYLTSNEIYKFTAEAYVETILDHIL
jgi:alpha(1,3/1,4) fucosyltransferase